MLLSPTSHYLRHVFLAYGQQGGRLKGRMAILEQLHHLETECLKLQKRHKDSPKLQATLERIKGIKALL